MHFAFIAPPLTGHYKPLAALAAELEARGHRATFVHQAGAAALAERHGARFAALGGDRLEEHRGVSGTVREMARQTDMLCRRAPALLRALEVDAVIADQLEPAGGLIARHLGLSLATVAAALPVNRDPVLPPPYVGWRYDPSPRGRRWSEGGWRIADWMMRPLSAVIRRYASEWRLGSRARLDDLFSDTLQLAQAIPSLDFPREALPAHFHYLGPFRRPREEESDPPGPPDRPLVYCSLGTLQGGRLRLFRSVAAACAELDLRLVVSHGGRLNAAQVARLAGQPAVFDHVPQEAVLAQADLVVTHAGFNTVLESLAAGLPMVAIPIAHDQPAVAARAQRAGVAEIVRPWQATPRRVRVAIERVLGTPSFRHRAGALRAEIGAAGGVSRAAHLIEAMER